MALSDRLGNLAVTTAFEKIGYDKPDYPMDALGNMSVELASNFRVMGVMRLLCGVADSCFHHWMRSGYVRLHYLQRCQAEDALTDRFYVASQTASLLDAIAAGQFDLATEIVSLSPVFYREDGYEYRNDYLFGVLLAMLLVAPEEFTEAEQEDMLDTIEERFAWCEEYIAPDDDPRLLVCQAIVMRDQDAFNTCFDDLLVAYEYKLEDAIEKAQFTSPAAVAARYVNVEAIALLRLARRFGLRTQLAYKYCPRLALSAMQKPFPGE